jgi:hypothetical protein
LAYTPKREEEWKDLSTAPLRKELSLSRWPKGFVTDCCGAEAVLSTMYGAWVCPNPSCNWYFDPLQDIAWPRYRISLKDTVEAFKLARRMSDGLTGVMNYNEFAAYLGVNRETATKLMNALDSVDEFNLGTKIHKSRKPPSTAITTTQRVLRIITHRVEAMDIGAILKTKASREDIAWKMQAAFRKMLMDYDDRLGAPNKTFTVVPGPDPEENHTLS